MSEEEHDQSPDGEEPTDNFNSMTNEQLMDIFRTFIPVELMLETLFVPFLQDYQPSIGDVDPFIKVQRPDGKNEPLGLVVLDEPCINESDPEILRYQLETLSKSIGSNEELQQSVDDRIRGINADKEEIDEWIKEVDKVHSMQGPAEINYTIRPPVDTIMEVWDPEMEGAVREYDMPKANIDLSVEEYAKFCCLMLDIPVGPNIIESMHMFFENYRDVTDANEMMKNYK